MPFEMAVRYALLFGARALGRALAIVQHPVVINTLLLVAIATALAILDDAYPKAKEEESAFLTFTRVLAIWALVLIAWWVIQQRRRLLVSRFDDGGEKGGAQGLSVLLTNELVQLRDLFNEFEDGRVIQTTADERRERGPIGRSQLFEATAQVDATGAFLESAISAESTLALGPLKIPMNVLLGLVNRLVQGPRIAGQVSSDSGRRIFTVELVMQGRRHQWRVEEAPPPAVPRTLASVARELASRMFADLAFDRPVRWSAVESLLEGLRAYRRTLRSTKEGRLNLHEAETHLLSAIAEDNRFDLAFYNLGVVYTSLDRLNAALSAFKRSVELNPDRFAGHYAMARVRYTLALNLPPGSAGAARELRFALQHCDQAFALAKSAQAKAQALALKALAQMRLQLFEATVFCRRAVSHAWRALLAAELALPWHIGPAPLDRQQAAELAANSLQHLVYIYHTARLQFASAKDVSGVFQRILVRSAQQRSLTAARIAAWLQPTDYSKLLDLGAIYAEGRRDKRAIRALCRAVELDPSRGEAWCWLAVVYARLFREEPTVLACDSALDAALTLPAPMLGKLGEALGMLADETEAVRTEVAGLRARFQGVAAIARPFIAFVVLSRLSYRISGREWRRFFVQMHAVSVGLLNVDGWAQKLADIVLARRAAAARLGGLADFRDQVTALRRGPGDPTAQLKTLYEEAKKDSRNWEMGHAADALGNVAQAQRRFPEALEWFQAAISAFKDPHPGEIVRRGIKVQMAIVLLQIPEKRAALDAASRAVEEDPLSNFERVGLANCHFNLQEWPAARLQGEQALRLTPDQPAVYHNIALCWFNEGIHAEARDNRRQCFRNAADNLDRALKLYDVDRIERLDGQFLLGRIQGLLGDPVSAHSLWQSLDSRGYRPLQLRLQLADSMLREVSFAEAERRFREAVIALDAELAADPKRIDTPIDGMPGDPDVPTYGAAAAWARLGIAAALARRQTGFDEALAQVRSARAVVSRFGNDDEKRRWMGNCDRIEGEVRFHQGQPKMALEPLERSLANRPTEEGYFYLAGALLALMDPKAEDSDARSAVVRIRALVEQSQRLDLNGEMEARVKALKTRLEATAAAKLV